MIYFVYAWLIVSPIVVLIGVLKIISDLKKFYRQGVMSETGLREEGQAGFNSRLSDHLKKTSFKKISSRRQAEHIIKTNS